MTNCPTSIAAQERAQDYGRKDEAGVGQLRLSDMPPDVLESYIRMCGRRMEAAYSRWEESGNFADRGDAGYWRLRMEEAIRMRTPQTVARMEEKRGLSRA